jgi:hypothetical protein
MRLTSTWPALALALGVGCAAIDVRERLEKARGRPIVTVERVSFDGKSVNGRLLIGSDDAGYVVVDRRLAEHSTFRIDDVRDCDGGATVDYVQLDGIESAPKPDDLLAVEPGYWFGRDFSLLMYDDEKAPPSCIQAVLGLTFEAAATGATYLQVPVRADLSTPDAGPSIEDAGTP